MFLLKELGMGIRCNADFSTKRTSGQPWLKQRHSREGAHAWTYSIFHPTNFEFFVVLCRNLFHFDVYHLRCKREQLPMKLHAPSKVVVRKHAQQQTSSAPPFQRVENAKRQYCK
jgi:hypothetical protein